VKKWAAATILFVFFLGSCSQSGEVDQDNGQNQVEFPLRGVSLSPRSMAGSDFTEFLDRVKGTQDVLMWAGDWLELATDGAPITVAGLADQYDYLPLIEVGHYIQESGELLRPLNEANRQLYTDSALEYVKDYQPSYFGMGVEINVFAVKNPGAFMEFVTFYNELYDRIKTASPETLVFTVFQLEKMKGLAMWEIEESQPQWEMIDQFKMDVVGFTTYPGLFYRDVSDIPEDHYLDILTHTSQPVVFTEIGWHSDSSPAGWESSQEEQAAFITRFFELTQDIDFQVAIWSFMYDLDVFQPFDSMGLIDREGIEKMSWEVWVK
jgi:hypothetical protein